MVESPTQRLEREEAARQIAKHIEPDMLPAYRLVLDAIPEDWATLGQLKIAHTDKAFEIARHLAYLGVIEERHQFERDDKGTRSWFEFRKQP